MTAHRPTPEDPRIFVPGIAIAFALVVLAFGAFAFDADRVASTPGAIALDAWAHGLAVRLRTDERTQVIRLVTYVGEGPSLALLSAIVGVWLWRAHSRRRLYAFAATMLGGVLLNQTLKAVFHRARPADAIVKLTEFSFPSGHSMGSMLLGASLAYVGCVTTAATWKRVVIGLAAAAAVTFVGATRIYLGVHYATDVLGGFACGLGWAAACIGVTELAAWRWHARRPRDADVA